MNLNHLINMGGYGLYVWPAYGITLLVFLINLLASFKEKRQIKNTIAQILLRCPQQ